MLCLGRDQNGYPADGIDVVPERNSLSTVVQLLKEQSERPQDKRDSLTKRYHDLYQDYIVLKYSDQFVSTVSDNLQRKHVGKLKARINLKRSRSSLLARVLRDAFKTWMKF